MERKPLVQDPSSFPAFPPRSLLTPLHISAHFLHRPSFTEPLETLPHPLAVGSSAPPSAQLPLCKGSHEPGRPHSQQRADRELDKDNRQLLYYPQREEQRNKGHRLQRKPGNSRSEKEKKSRGQILYGKGRVTAACRYEKSRDDRPSINNTDTESPDASIGGGSSKDFVSGASEGESERENTNSNDSSSGKDIAGDLSLQEDEKGEVSPLRALSHIAHIKRKQDCMQAKFEEVRDLHGLDDMHRLSDDVAHGSSSKKRRFKQVQFRLEALTYKRLTNFLAEQHQGSFQRFVMATLNSIVVQDKMEKKTAMINRRPGFSKWKRTRFDQLKGTETQDLAIAFRSLAEAMPNVEVPSELMHTPWQELSMLQIQKMLEETKKMLLVNEKSHDCPYADCGRRFSTPGSLKDHLNEHSGEQPYRCSFEDCPHRFRSKQHLCRHMKKHERAHTCTFQGCNKRFAFRERLIVHQKIHSDERPLSCPWEGCGKTFKWANSLHGHMRTHTGEKPFQCTFAGCGRLFGYKVDLTRHRRTHFGQPARASH